MILHERLYNKHDLHLNLTCANRTELVLWNGMRQTITRTNDVFFLTGLYKLSVKFGKSFFFSKYLLFFLQQYIAEALNVSIF